MQQVEATPDILASQENKHWNDMLAKEKEIEHLNDQVRQKDEQMESLEKQLDLLEQKAHQNNTVQNNAVQMERFPVRDEKFPELSRFPEIFFQANAIRSYFFFKRILMANFKKSRSLSFIRLKTIYQVVLNVSPRKLYNSVLL